MAPWIVAALAAIIVLKPQEFVPLLNGVPVVYISFGAALFFIVVDIIWKKLKPGLAPQIPLVFAMLIWGLVVVGAKASDQLGVEAMKALILVVVFLAVSIGVSSARGLTIFVGVWLACSVAVTCVAAIQGFRPHGCFVAAADDWEGKGELTFDGRPCETVFDCTKDAPQPNANYRCERPGPWSTATQGDRVRYRGSLADPNELSLMIATSIPLAIAFFGVKKKREEEEETSPEEDEHEARAARRALNQLPPLVTNRFLDRVGGIFRAIPTGIFIAAVGLVIVLSKSRGGLLVFLIVLAVQFIRKAGAWGIVAGCLVAPPMLLLGGRGGTEAEESADERVGLLREGLEHIRNTKGIGIGMGRFPDESSIGLTAHNAYVLAAAEIGIVGIILFGLIMYVSIKVPVAIWYGDYDIDARLKRLAPAIAIALASASVGIFFLSWTYKDILYILLGMSAALYGAARAEDKRIKVGLSAREVAAVSAAMMVLLCFVYVLARVHK